VQHCQQNLKNSFSHYCIHTDSEDEWRLWNRLGDPVMHIELRDWADCLVVAPLSAHTLAKLANGLCDDVLSSVARAWDFSSGGHLSKKPMVLAPAMNTYMWEHPITKQQLERVQHFFGAAAVTAEGMSQCCPIVQPQVKTLACGQLGNGALAEVSDIVDAVRAVFAKT
jgi:phosphopantothenoylcysteine decarboxylase